MKIISTQIQSMRFCDSQHVLRGNRLQSEEGGGSHWGNNENNVSWDFPGDPVVKTPLANAGGPRFHAWSRKIPHATGQLSPCTITTEAQVPWSPCWAIREACTLQLEKAGLQQQRHSTVKNK